MQHFYNDSFLLNTAVEALLSLAHHQDHGSGEEQTSEMIFQRRNGTDASPTGSSRMKNSTSHHHVSGLKMNPKKRKNSFKGVNTASKLSFPLEVSVSTEVGIYIYTCIYICIYVYIYTL